MMMTQTRIDQFYKKINVRRKSHVMNECVKSEVSKNDAYKKENNAEDNLPVQSVKLESTSDCMIMYESFTTNHHEESLAFVNRATSRTSRIKSITPSTPKKKDTKSKTEKKSPVSPRRYRGRMQRKINESSKRKSMDINNHGSPSKKPKEEEVDFLESALEAGLLDFSDIMTNESNYASRVETLNVTVLDFNSDIEKDRVTFALQQMSFAKQGIIPENDFNLEEIYSEPVFVYNYSNENIKTSNRYDAEEVTLPSNENNGKILFNVIISVFSKPINCGYFDKDELDFVYSILTLSVRARILLARMLKRVRTWHRKSSIQYPDIAQDLRPVFEELQAKSICTLDTTGEDIHVLLRLLHADELSQICKTLKRNSSGRKETNLCELMRYAKEKPLFLGTKTPKSILASLILKKIDYCIRLTEKTWNIFDKIITLLIPNQDPQMTVSDTFFMLLEVYKERMLYPEMPKQQYPIFSSKTHLHSYVKAKKALTNTLNSIDKKQWEKVRHYGDLAERELQTILKDEFDRLKDSSLPMHLRCFMPGYMWLKVLAKSVDAFKKETKDRAMQILAFLAKQKCHMQNRTGRWYAELALIEMCHKKNLERSAQIVMKALKKDCITPVDRVDLVDRAQRIMKKKTGISEETKLKIQRILEDIGDRVQLKYKPPTKTISGQLRSGNIGNKSKWLIEATIQDQSYGTVEQLALSYYQSEGFTNGVHCEGALPILLFSTLFWEELYMDIPGAFVTEYQDAPQDLFFEQFYENRQESIDMKLQIAQSYDAETFSGIMENKFKEYSKYQSLMQTRLFPKCSYLKEVVHCLGVEGVVGICRRLVDNFKLWRAGFPDLIVWNFSTKQYKIVEVKGPGDTLSTKQTLWLEYLCQLGLDIELCTVKDDRSSKRSS